MLEGMKPAVDARGCRVGSVLAELDDSDRQILEDALADSVRWSAHGLMNALRERGVHMSIHPILNHRKGICRCSRI
jgi:hypothetical protein